MQSVSNDLSDDAFLGGRLNILQPKKGYRAGIDPVLLAAATPAVPGQTILEIGCGAGVAALCLGTRVPDLTITGLELQADYADLARQNASRNNMSLDVLVGDLRAPPASLRQMNFDHVIANPPYYTSDGRSKASNPGRETARASGDPLGDWVDFAIKRTVPRGRMTFIQRGERLAELLGALDTRVGDIRVLPVIPRENADATLILVHARKGARGALKLHSPLKLHDNPRHLKDGDDYAGPVTDILRNGAALDAF